MGEVEIKEITILERIYSEDINAIYGIYIIELSDGRKNIISQNDNDFYTLVHMCSKDVLFKVNSDVIYKLKPMLQEHNTFKNLIEETEKEIERLEKNQSDIIDLGGDDLHIREEIWRLEDKLRTLREE